MDPARHPEAPTSVGALSTLDRAARRALIALVHGYQASLSHYLGGQCRFFPTCSCYAEEALLRKPLPRALSLTVWRILRCSPLTKAGYDPVPHDDGEEAHYLDRPRGADPR